MSTTTERELLVKLDRMAEGAISALGFPERQIADAVRASISMLIAGMLERIEQLEAKQAAPAGETIQ